MPFVTLVCALAIRASWLAAADTDAAKYWPQWRGPHATGVSKTATPPVEWSESRNIKWKVEIPGRGSASPVVWGSRVYVLSAVPAGVAGAAEHQPRGGVNPRDTHRFVVLAIDRATGAIAWQRTACEVQPHEASHQQNGSYASSSAIVDGERVYAWFESQGMFVYDLQGTLLWKKDLGDKKMRNQFGEGSTPVLDGDRLVVVGDQFVPGQSFIVALNKRTGDELWRVPRDENDTWATPLVVEANGRAQVIVPAMNKVRAYDLENGAIVWESPGTTMNAIPSPVAEGGLVFVTSGFRGNNLKAIRLDGAKGDIGGTPAIAWSLDRDTPYVPSPLLYDGLLYLLKTNTGLLSVFDARTGAPHYALQRLEGISEVFSSPVGAGGRVYVTGRDGETLVIKHGPKYEVLATNHLDDGFDASPALVENEIYMRGYKSLYAIAAK
jgi:outer membrane protein assembly factor BamB